MLSVHWVQPSYLCPSSLFLSSTDLSETLESAEVSVPCLKHSHREEGLPVCTQLPSLVLCPLLGTKGG